VENIPLIISDPFWFRIEAQLRVSPPPFSFRGAGLQPFSEERGGKNHPDH
jgi:hypothetical protein